MFHPWLLIPIPILILAGCRPSTPAKNTPSDSSVVLLTVGDRPVTQADFDHEASRRPNLASEAVLSNLVLHAAMLIRAEASGIADTPAYRRAAEERLIAEWLSATHNQTRDALEVTDDELQAAYENRLAHYTTPSLPRFAILHRKGRDTDELSDALNDALALFEADREAATNNGRLQGFGKIAAEHSEDTVSRYRGGDIGWVGEGMSRRIPDEILEAGRALAVGETAGPIAAGDGVYAIMKTGEREASRLEFKDAAPNLRGRLLAEKRAAHEARFREDVMSGLTVRHLSEPVARPPARKPADDTPPFGGFGETASR